MIPTQSTLTITEARARLLAMPEEFAKDRMKAIAVTKRGTPVMAVVPWDLYESILETLEVMGDPELMADLRQSIKEAQAAKTIPWSKIRRGLGL